MYNVSTCTEMAGNTPLLMEYTNSKQETLDSSCNRGKIKQVSTHLPIRNKR